MGLDNSPSPPLDLRGGFFLLFGTSSAILSFPMRLPRSKRPRNDSQINHLLLLPLDVGNYRVYATVPWTSYITALLRELTFLWIARSRGCVAITLKCEFVLLNEVKNLMESMCYKTEILRLGPQNDIVIQRTSRAMTVGG